MSFLRSLCLIFILCALPVMVPVMAMADTPYLFNDAFIRETPMKVSAGYVVITNPTDKDDKLLVARADWADRIELHNVKAGKDGVMQMYRVRSIDLPAKGTAALRPGAYHLMIFGVKEKLVPGDLKKITLGFKKAGNAEIKFTVQSMSYKGNMASKTDMGHNHHH